MSVRRQRLQTWAGCVLNLAFILLTVDYVSEAIDRPSVYRVSLAVVGIALSISVCWSSYRAITGRERPTITYPRKDPTTVPFDDVVSAIEATPSRIDAVRELRERHPGLNLKGAADLVDEVMARPDL